MPSLKTDAVTLIRRGAHALRDNGNDSTAFALILLANHLRLLMRGEVTIEQWNEAYAGKDGEPLDADIEVPVKAA